MNVFPAITFFHVSGAIALFISWALEYNYLNTQIQSSIKITEVIASKKLKNYTKAAGIAVFITLSTGIWLMIDFGTYPSWMIVALVSIFLIKIIDVLYLRKASSVGSEPLAGIFYLVSSIRLRITTGIGIIALMVFKPMGILTSLSILLISLIFGAFASWISPPLKGMRLEKPGLCQGKKSKSGNLSIKEISKPVDTN